MLTGPLNKKLDTKHHRPWRSFDVFSRYRPKRQKYRPVGVGVAVGCNKLWVTFMCRVYVHMHTRT